MPDLLLDDEEEVGPVAPPARTVPPSTSSVTGRSSSSASFGWRWFITPRAGARRGTMPAGAVLAIVLPALLLAMFLNAPATLRKSNARDKGPWRRAMAEKVDAVSSALKIDVPRDTLDERLGRNETQQVESVDELVARQRAASATIPVGVATTQPSSGKPTLHAATPTSKLKIWVGGDSQMQPIGPEARPVFEGSGLFSLQFDYKPSSGLTRPDYVNWPKHLVDTVTRDDPDVMVLLFGANDAQGMPIAGSGGYPLYSPEWLAEYRKRVASTMDLLRSPTDDRLIVWIGALPMGPASGVKGMEKLNAIYASEALRRPWVIYFDSVPFFTDAGSNYAASLPSASGKLQLLRASDNIHLTWAGARRLIWAVYGRLGREIDLKASAIPFVPPDDVAPVSVHERSPVPDG